MSLTWLENMRVVGLKDAAIRKAELHPNAGPKSLGSLSRILIQSPLPEEEAPERALLLFRR